MLLHQLEELKETKTTIFGLDFRAYDYIRKEPYDFVICGKQQIHYRNQMSRVSVTPEMLTWACERAGYDVDYFARRIPNLKSWVRQEKKPTFKQLEKFANHTYTPFGYFFYPEPPEENDNPIVDFRTIFQKKNKLSRNLIDTINYMLRRQEWLQEYLIEKDSHPLDFVGCASLNEKPKEIAIGIRKRLGLEKGWSNKIKTWQAAIGLLRDKMDDIGVMVVINGVVGNNTRRTLDVNEFRGFALVNSYTPLIFVNAADSKSAQMFTLAHELAHIWLGKGGISNLEKLYPNNIDVEIWCNQVAAEFLVPEEELLIQWNDVKNQTNRFEYLARKFKVSPIVVYRRVLDLRFINRDHFFKIYNNYMGKELKNRGVGGDFYNNQNSRIGKLFALNVLNSAIQGRTDFKEAYDLLGLYGGTFQEFAKKKRCISS